MSQITRTSGDLKQVAVYDAPVTSTGAGANSGVNAVTSGVTVQPQGPKLDYFTITLATVASNVTLAAQTIQAIQQLATIYMYEFTDTTTDTLAVAVYPTGAWNTTTLGTATGGSVATGATFNG